MNLSLRWPLGVRLAFATGAVVLGALGALGDRPMAALFWGCAVAACGEGLRRTWWRLEVADGALRIRGLTGWRTFPLAEVRVSFRRRQGSRIVPSEPEDAEDLVLWGPPGLRVRLPKVVEGWEELGRGLEVRGQRLERLPPPSPGERLVEWSGPAANGAIGLAALAALVGVAGLGAALLVDTDQVSLTGDAPTDAALLAAAALGAWLVVLAAGQAFVRSTRVLRDPGQVGLRGMAMLCGGMMGVFAVLQLDDGVGDALGMGVAALVMGGLAFAPNRG